MTVMFPDDPPPGVYDPLGLGFPCTIPPLFAAGAGTIVTANRCYYLRVIGGGRINKIAMDVFASSGNISVALYRTLGMARDAVPGAQVATSGAVACPAIGYAEVSLGGSYTVYPGNWFAISADNVTASFRILTGGSLDTNLAKGSCFYQASAHPAPSAAGTLVATTGRPFCLVGVPA